MLFYYFFIYILQKSRANSDIDDLLDDDLDLLDENVGRKVGGRVAISDDEEDDRERIKGDLFGHVIFVLI